MHAFWLRNLSQSDVGVLFNSSHSLLRIPTPYAFVGMPFLSLREIFH